MTFDLRPCYVISMNRRKTRIIKIGNVYIGGNHPIAIQSMAKAKTADVRKTVTGIKGLEKAGCEIVRLAIKDEADAKAIRQIKSFISIPIVADIHFNWRLAILAVENGADKIRLNPGNIYKKEELRNIITALKMTGISLRVGVNSGSVRDLNRKNLSPADKLVRSALEYIKFIEKMKFYDIVISLKASNVRDTLSAYRKMSEFCDYPLHLGLTATGSALAGIVKSSIAIGSLLLEGIGDTVRISLTDKPQAEVAAAKLILQSLGLRNFGPEIISCPTCGRCEVNLIKAVKDLNVKLMTYDFGLMTEPLKIAVMGCVVNGPGEAKEADIGIAFGKKDGLLFKKGIAIKKVSFKNCVDMLIQEVPKWQK